MGIRAFRVGGKTLAELEADPVVNGIHVTVDVLGEEPCRTLIVRRARMGDAVRVACPVSGAMPIEAARHSDQVQLYLPRTCHVSAYYVTEPGADRSHVVAAKTLAAYPGPSGVIDSYGPLRSRVMPYSEAEIQDPYRGPRYGQWWPLAEYWTGSEWSPNPGAQGGTAIGPYQGTRSARYWLDMHCRIMDRSTVHLWDAAAEAVTVDSMRDAQGLVASERYIISTGAMGNAASSILPNGQSFQSPIMTGYEPLVAWQSTCGKQHYDTEHGCRGWRAAHALAYQHNALDIVRADLAAWAHESSYYMCPYEAVPDMYGPGSRAPGSTHYMYNQSLAYVRRGPQTIVRGYGWGSYAIAEGLNLDETSLETTAGVALDFWRNAVTPSGFFQAAGWEDLQGPSPRSYGVLADELSAAKIEAPIALGGACALALQLYGETSFPAWLRTAIDNQVQTVLRFWPNIPKYLIVKKGTQWYTPDQVRPCPGGPRGSLNNFWLLEMGLRFGSVATQNAVLAMRAEIESRFAAEPIIRPWCAGLAGALS